MQLGGGPVPHHEVNRAILKRASPLLIWGKGVPPPMPPDNLSDSTVNDKIVHNLTFGAVLLNEISTDFNGNLWKNRSLRLFVLCKIQEYQNIFCNFVDCFGTGNG